MYRFLLRPIWILFHVVVIAAIAGMLWAAVWQLDRLSERKEFNAVVTERSEQPARPLRDLLADLDAGRLDPETAEWIPVRARGTYLPDQVLEFNNSQGGRAGDNVLTALVLDPPAPGDTDDTSTVIVNRGFVPLGFDVPDAPATAVDITGFVRPSEVRRLGGLTDAPTDGALTEIRRIDIPVLAAQFPGEVAPVFIQLTQSTPPIAGSDPSPVVLPELSNGPHLSYAIQWFIFALSVAAGWVLAVRRSMLQRRRDTHAGGAHHDDADVATAEASERTATGSR